MEKDTLLITMTHSRNRNIIGFLVFDTIVKVTFEVSSFIRKEVELENVTICGSERRIYQ